MKTLSFKNPIAILSFAAMVIGTAVFVHGKAKPEEILIDEAITETVHWYGLQETNSTDESQQLFSTGEPMPGTPPVDDEEACAQSLNEGPYCGVALRFAGSNPDTDLSGYSNLQDVLDNHPDVLGIATGNPAIDEDEDGYSRSPEPEDA